MLARQIAAEWIKLRSLRSTWAIIGIGVVAIIAQAVTALATGGVSDTRGDTLDVMSGSDVTLILLVVLGVMVMASEYSQKSIITTYTVSPARRVVLLAKAIVVVAVALALGLISVPLDRFVAAVWFALGSGSWEASFGDGVEYAIGIMIAFAGYAALGVMIGALVRSTAVGVGVAFGALFVLDPLLGNVSVYTEYALSSVGTSLMDPDVHQSGDPRYGAAIALIALYVAILTAIATSIERRRDV
jgi:ABC-2 type transport system permease protein